MFKVGQKWISNAEPELGMGRITRAEPRQVKVYFDITSEERNYAESNAPLTRVRFKIGEQINTVGGLHLEIDRITESEGILTYHGVFNGTPTAIMETELDPNVRFSTPEDRLFTHQFDQNIWFDLRYHTLMQRAEIAHAGSRGLYGPRVSLIPHQLYIATEVGRRFAPRVLLADEVGLGKTIEAGLIIHRQLQTGQASRVLIIVPEALTFQWFVEMIRRFNLQFTLIDEERLTWIAADNADVDDVSADPDEHPDPNPATDQGEPFNPFDAQQLMITTLSLFVENRSRLRQAIETDWDLIVVDEAHHLAWSEDAPSPEYMTVEILSQVAGGLMLLTATPEQLGREGHFARLRLLDPDRFHDYNQFTAEEAGYAEVAALADQLHDAPIREELAARLKIAATSEPEVRRALLDRHGTGRVLFRNARSAVAGFPAREPLPVPLTAPPELGTGYFPEAGIQGWPRIDPRVDWLIDQLLGMHGGKALVICARQETALELREHLEKQAGIRSTVFHEGMDLVARDRAATYFAEVSGGAQVMVCSEIGSEGRNFQFAHHLVLFDLPPSPDLLEQRIGRLDRIGQTETVRIHIPYLIGTDQERLFRFFNGGLNAFAEPNPGAQGLFDELFNADFDADADLEDVRLRNLERRRVLLSGRDRLLELHSHDVEVSRKIVRDINESEAGSSLSRYMELSFDAWGLESEPLDDHSFVVKATEQVVRNAAVSLDSRLHYRYPDVPEEGLRYTYDRETALAREDLHFLTWEHPLVSQAMDLVTSDFVGNSAILVIKHELLKPGTVLLEALQVVDCVAPPMLQIDRFLPPTVLRSLIDPNLRDLSARVAYRSFQDLAVKVPAATRRQILDSQAPLIEQMIAAARSAGSARLDELALAARQLAAAELAGESERLVSLRKVNPSVRVEEIEHVRAMAESIDQLIATAELRLDALRVIVAS
jgi:ATP-dependent helicase HepA